MNIIPDSALIGSDKTFISKLLGEMKNQFNKTENKINSQGDEENLNSEDEPSDVTFSEESDKNSELINNLDITIDDSVLSSTVEENKEEIASDKSVNDDSVSDNCTLINTSKEDNMTQSNGNDKPRLVMKFLKPTSKSNKNKAMSPSKKKLKNVEEEKNVEISLKRSSRRRSSESILQSAIARKEKSYNESLKPQRSTRLLKPTQKILDNLANAAALKLEKSKIKLPKNHEKQRNFDDMETDSNDDKKQQNKSNMDDQRKHKTKHHNKHKKSVKRLKVSQNDYKDSDSDQASTNESKEDLSLSDKCNGKNSKNKLNEDRMYRRSQRLSSRYACLIFI